MKIGQHQLIGRWVCEFGSEEKSNLEFCDDGELFFIVETSKTKQKIQLTYRVDDGVLITDQPSQPQEERTRLSFTLDGKLWLSIGGQDWLYRREVT
jgi:flagellar hook assembly protein FlgD